MLRKLSIMQKMEGYKAATEIDAEINALYERFPPDDNNWLDWLNFCRTVASGLHIIEEIIKKEKGGKEWMK